MWNPHFVLQKSKAACQGFQLRSSVMVSVKQRLVSAEAPVIWVCKCPWAPEELLHPRWDVLVARICYLNVLWWLLHLLSSCLEVQREAGGGSSVCSCKLASFLLISATR